jgi:hypothetical protein
MLIYIIRSVGVTSGSAAMELVHPGMGEIEKEGRTLDNLPLSGRYGRYWSGGITIASSLGERRWGWRGTRYAGMMVRRRYIRAVCDRRTHISAMTL